MNDQISGPVGGLGSQRKLSGFAVAVVVPILLTIVLVPYRQTLGLDTVLLLFVLASVVASVLGGVLPALIASVVSFTVANFFFTQPYATLTVASVTELIDLVIFFAVAVLVGVVTEIGARARGRAERARIEAEWLADLGNQDQQPQSVERALSRARVMFSMNQVQLASTDEILASTGERRTGDIEILVPATADLEVRLYGPERLGVDRKLLDSMAQTAARLWRTEQLGEQARRAEELAHIDRLRASLLAAVGHDLRNPLAAITVAAETLRQEGIELSPRDQAELLDTIEEHTQRLNHIIGNLLDASRLRAGAVSVHPQPTDLLEVLTGVLRSGESRVELAIADDLPAFLSDPGLLERVLANLVDNADRHVAEGGPVTIEAHVDGVQVAISVIDHGRGVPPERYGEIFAPFQHFNDQPTTGVGLGLAIARGFTEAMNGTLTPSLTPGGGLTMTVRLEVVDD